MYEYITRERECVCGVCVCASKQAKEQRDKQTSNQTNRKTKSHTETCTGQGTQPGIEPSTIRIHILQTNATPTELA